MQREKGGFWIAFASAFFYPIAWLCGRIRFEGREHVPADGGVLVVGNHISYLDPVYTAIFVHRAGRLPRFLAKHGLWTVPVLRWIMRGTGQIPVHRDSTDAQSSLREATAALREGKAVVIYPEGTITRDPSGWPMVARTGVARLALSVDVPVVPTVHWGTREVLDWYGRRFRPLPRSTVVVRAGRPVDLSAYRGRAVDAELLREVTDLLMCHVRELLAEVRGQTAPTTFFRRGAAS